jgi:hypothetical protein
MQFPDYEEPKKATVFPLLGAVVFLLSSVVIGVLDWQGVSPFTYTNFNLLGYVLTPFLVFMCVAWDAAAQRSGRRSPWFDIRPGYSKALRALAIAALLVAVYHIVELGRAFGEWVVQTGVV